MKYGLQGFIPEYGHKVLELKPESVSNILDMGGTILGSSRGTQDIEEIVDCLERMNIGILFMVGGDGTLVASKKIADEMIDGYTHLNDSISKTLDLISDVESASKEQLQGIEQINNAVTELDQQTQQNASVANATQDIAIQTQNIAHDIVNDANEKEFIGKNEVEAKEINHIQKVDQTPAKSTSRKSTSEPTQPIISSNNDKDKWESF